MTEQFVRLELYKLRSLLPNLTKSGSVKREVSQHKVVFGGSIRTSIDGYKKSRDHDKRSLADQMKEYYLAEEKTLQR